MVFDPFSIAALGVGTLGSLAGGIYNAATAGDRKKEWLKHQQKIAQLTAARHDNLFGNGGFYGADRNYVDALINKKETQREADERFKVDPMTFLPFVQNGTALAGALYGAGKSAPQGSQTAVGPRSGATMRSEDFYDLPGTYGPSSGARMSGDDFFDPEELQFYRGRY